MASPIATGGAGIHLESQIAAYYLAATLMGGAVRGLPAGSVATGVRLQRAFEGAPLDDVIASATSAVGTATLSLQVKRTLVIGESELFMEVLEQCWQTLNGQGFKPGLDRFGLAIGIPDVRFERAGRNVLSWARQSADAKDFFKRIAANRVASDDMRAFLGIIRNGLEKVAGSTVDEIVTWQFLSHLVVLSFDFEQVDESANRIEITERLRYALHPQDCERAPDLWLALVDIADRAKPAAGSLDRAALIEKLHTRFQLAGQRQIQGDLEKIRDVSARALDDIRTDLGGVRLTRPTLSADLEAKVARTRLVEVVGEAGSGKSALIKEFAERNQFEGPIMFLSAKRMPTGAPGWDGLARHWGVDAPLAELLAELSCVRHPCLFIDGIDRLEDIGAWLAVNDLLHAIRRSASVGRWTVILSVRSNSLGYRTHMDLGDMESSAERIVVGDLDAAEIEQVAAAHPQLVPLIGSEGRAAGMAARPFLLDRLIRGSGMGMPGEGLLSEIDLMESLWTGTVSSEALSPALVLARQDVLLELGRRRLTHPSRPPTSVELNGEALLSLVSDDLLRHDLSTREVTFPHDILEDWTLCQSLNHDGRDLSEIIDRLGQPLWLVDAVQLLAQQRLERNQSVDVWRKSIDEVSRSPLQPRWRRAVLTAPLQSTRATELLTKVADLLWQEDGAMLAELMTAMRTIEVDPDPRALDPELFPDYDDATRMQLAHAWAMPRWRSWRHFLPWLVPKLDLLPATRVEEATRVLKTWAQAHRVFPPWAAPKIVRWARDWLARIELTEGWGSYEKVRSVLDQMGVGYDDDDELRERFRFLIVTTAQGAEEQVTEHLSEVITKPHRKAAKFFVEYSNWLVDPLPTELVDFLLTVMLPEWTDERYSSDPTWSLNELGVEFHHQYFPASHLRPPFLALLRQYPVQGIRLINGRCNHAMDVWRDILLREREGTPLPVRIAFPWGEREFLGHAREYTWFRAIGPGPYPVESALMALEVWMEEQFAAGRDMEAIFLQVLEGNRCVGALGACVSIVLANPEKSLKVALPLATCPQLWEWDLRRQLQERDDQMSNLIGPPRARSFLLEVAKRNRLPHRKRTLRELALYYLKVADAQTLTEFQERLAILEDIELPFEFIEQRGNPKVADELRDRIRRMLAEASPDNYKTSIVEAEDHLLIEYRPPTDLTPSTEDVELQEVLNRSMKVALWTEKSLETNTPLPDLTLAEAVAIAKELDLSDLFDQSRSVDEFLMVNRVGAVAGAAAMALKFGEPSDELFTWGRDVLYRALNTPLDTDPMIIEQSDLMFHPVVTGATALTALIERGLSTEEERLAVLALVCHPLLKVKKAVFRGLSTCWDKDPLLCWQAFALGMRLSLESWDLLNQRYGSISLARPESEDEWVKTTLAAIEEDWRAGRYSELPFIPLPWVEDERPDQAPQEPTWRRSDVAFLWHIAPIVLDSQPLSALLATAENRRSVLRLASELLDWTIEDAVPPFFEDRDDGGRAYEWAQSFMDWCAILTEYLSVEETEVIIVSPIAAVCEKRDGEDLLQELMFGFIRHRFSQDRVPDDITIQVWNRLCEIVFSRVDANRSGDREWLSRGYEECIALAVFSYAGLLMFDHPWAALEAVKPTIERWVEQFGESDRYYTQLTVFLAHAGQGLFPEPALDWLYRIVVAKKADQRFWQANDNGSKTAVLIAQLIEDHGAAIVEDRSKVARLVEMSDILIAKGIRQASLVQQRLAVLYGAG